MRKDMQPKTSCFAQKGVRLGSEIALSQHAVQLFLRDSLGRQILHLRLYAYLSRSPPTVHFAPLSVPHLPFYSPKTPWFARPDLYWNKHGVKR